MTGHAFGGRDGNTMEPNDRKGGKGEWVLDDKKQSILFARWVMWVGRSMTGHTFGDGTATRWTSTTVAVVSAWGCVWCSIDGRNQFVDQFVDLLD